jgi:hypothetical protein
MSSSKYESADLILKLYEMRREPVMREARNWMIGFSPESAQDIMQALINPQTSAYYRMVTTYWDMACSLVNNGAIDEQMFTDAAGEHVVIFSKIEPFLEELRQTMQNPNILKNLEMLVMRIPNAKEVLAGRREMMKRLMQAREEMAKAAPQG